MGNSHQKNRDAHAMSALPPKAEIRAFKPMFAFLPSAGFERKELGRPNQAFRRTAATQKN
jgi:hypothetical protein